MKSLNFMKTKKLVSLVLVLSMLIVFIPTISVGAVGEKAAASKVVNVVFVLDTTGSMSDEIANVRSNLNLFANTIAAFPGIDLRMALITYEDITADGMGSTVVFKSKTGSPWFSDTSELISTINSLRISGGGDSPETVYDGLGYLVCDADYADAMLFNSNAYKFAFVLTDDSIKTDNRFGITGMSDMVERLASRNIYTSVISPSGYKSVYKNLYEGTGGIWMDIYGDFSVNMTEYAQSIIDTIRPDVVDISIELGTTYNFQTLASGFMNNIEAAKYTSDNPSVLSFSEHSPYLAAANSVGTCSVSITDGEKLLECNITVEENKVFPVQELKISTEVIVGVDQSVIIKAVALPEEAKERGLIWSVKDPSVVEIVEIEENHCQLKGLKTGETLLTAVTMDGGYAGSAVISVVIDPIVPVTGVSISLSKCTMNVGDTRTVDGSVTPSKATNNGGYWYSSNSEIVKIVSSSSTSCTFEAVHCGTAKVYFVSDEGAFEKYVEVTIYHNEDTESKLIEKPTCYKEGVEAYLCTICGDVIRTETIGMLDHTYGSWSFVSAVDGGIIGYMVRNCTECGAEEREAVRSNLCFYTDETKASYGEDFDLNVCIRKDSYFNDVQLVFNYDSSVFDVNSVTFTDTSATISRVTINEEKGQIRILYSSSETITDEMAFITVNLSVKKNVSYQIVPALWIDEASYNVCHVLCGGETITIDMQFEEDFGVVKILGKDPNSDGELDIRDLFAILENIIDEYDPFDAEMVDRFDCNYDGVVDIADITYLQNIIAMMD